MSCNLDYEVEVLSRIVSINTDVESKIGYNECAEVIAEEAGKLGLNVSIYDSVELADDSKHRPNVVAKLDVGSDLTVSLVTHYDVVPSGVGWSSDPFKLKIADGKAYGRGAADDKGAIAAALGALKLVGEKAEMNVVLIASPDEEVGGELGVGYLLNRVGIKCDEAVVLDASPEFVSIGASGVVNGWFRVKGVQGHAGYPHKAVNPIYGMARLIEGLEVFSNLRATRFSKIDSPPNSPVKKVWGRFSVTMVRSGVKSNVIPGDAEACFDMRTLPDENPMEAVEEFKAYFLSLAKNLGLNAEIYRIGVSSGYYTKPDHEFVVRFRRVISKIYGREVLIAAELGGNDGKFFAAKGIPVVSFGCIGPDTNFHGVDEFVYLRHIALVRDVILEYISTHP
ncbi:M20/M25/M40 family metallo-hydrolase [Candidatus Bathyarchaeota archaeon]|nr:M20/M25/M40 family metallo-hydrolase [Candidatus Bathyarchaeota archaeon]MBS7612751.1 M20/M25/M40 family metallo-hydrolase [Candidatus Bathyarchaeota archaeon]